MATLLVASMLPSLVGSAGQASAMSLQGSYEVWIRSQLRVPADAQIETALEQAAESEASTVKEFIVAFVVAYQKERPNAPAARAFIDRDLTDNALIAYLQRRFTEVAPEAMVPRIRSVVPPVTSSLAAMGSMAAVTTSQDVPPALRTTTPHAAQTELVIPLRILSSARSQGP